MRRIIRDCQIVSDDSLHLADGDALPASGRCSVSLARWRAERETLLRAGLVTGVRLPNDADADEVWPELAGAAWLVLEFPKFGDGRAFSQARVLRERHGFAGEIRATGEVLRDQLWHMQRCGINAFELAPGRSPEDALKAFSEISFCYQGAADQAGNVFRRRAASG